MSFYDLLFEFLDISLTKYLVRFTTQIFVIDFMNPFYDMANKYSLLNHTADAIAS